MGDLTLMTLTNARGEMAAIGCVYDDTTLQITSLWSRGDEATGIRVAVQQAPVDRLEHVVDRPAARTTNTRPRNWFLTRGSEGDLIIPFSVQMMET